jgi:hypothetical protein
MWSSQWNENWQGKPKYSEKTFPNATLSRQQVSAAKYTALAALVFISKLLRDLQLLTPIRLQVKSFVYGTRS